MDSLSRVARIIFCENASEEYQWEAAQLIAEELADGKSIRQLASEIGKGKSHVHRMSAVWDRFKGVPPEGQDFNACYQQFQHKPAPVPAAPPSDDELTEFESDISDEQADWDSLPVEENYEGVKEGDPESNRLPKLEPIPPGPISLMTKFRDIRVRLGKIADSVTQYGIADEGDVRDVLLNEVAWSRNALEMIESGIKSGTIEDAIARLLEQL